MTVPEANVLTHKIDFVLVVNVIIIKTYQSSGDGRMPELPWHGMDTVRAHRLHGSFCMKSGWKDTSGAGMNFFIFGGGGGGGGGVPTLPF